jgi:hypothetical protein
LRAAGSSRQRTPRRVSAGLSLVLNEAREWRRQLVHSLFRRVALNAAIESIPRNSTTRDLVFRDSLQSVDGHLPPLWRRHQARQRVPKHLHVAIGHRTGHALALARN